MSIPSKLWRWAYYDFANSAYILIYQTYLLPVLFANMYATKGLGLGAWGLANGISTLLGVLFSLIIGRLSDSYKKIIFFKWSIVGSFIGMLLISLSISLFPNFLFLIFVVTNACFIVTLTLSDSILPFIATKEEAYKASGFAWGFGYVGGVIGLLAVLILQKFFGEYSSFNFLFIAIFYMIFSAYSYSGLRKVPLTASHDKFEKASTISRISSKSKVWLLIGYWLISECITVVILFFSIFASEELHLSTLSIGIALLAVQIIAFPATWFGGNLSRKINSIHLLGITVVIWGMVICSMVFLPGIVSLVFAVIFTGLVLGNSQSILRAQYSTLINPAESGFQFGIYSIASEASVFIGPIIYGYASDALHSQKIPILILFALMALGYLIVRKITFRNLSDTF